MFDEQKRLAECKSGTKQWRKWGPYLSERQWGTVREDYSADGDAWNYSTYWQAVSKTYRWGEDGIGGISDDKQQLCFSVALWNGKDPIIKERLYGLSNPEGNHGEDVKEIYFYLDNTPLHSYMKMLYKYPQNEFPYRQLLEENKRRGKLDPEFELMDTGIFDNDEYFDVFIEYAKLDTDDICIKIEVANRSAKEAELNIIPQVWFRNTWSWGYGDDKPAIKKTHNSLQIDHQKLGKYELHYYGEPELLFCNNENNIKKLYNGDQEHKYCKDGINDYLVHGDESAISKTEPGTKAGLNYSMKLKGGESQVIYLRLTDKHVKNPLEDCDKIFIQALEDADKYYSGIQHHLRSDEMKSVQRQAFAGLLWSKQFYYYNVDKWLKGDPAQPAPPEERKEGRNSNWENLNTDDIISVPDTWEYPWFAVWDLAFHAVSYAAIDPEFAKKQLLIFTREWYMHPNGQLPAYEWNFDDVNPPVHAWAAWRVYKIDQKMTGKGDTQFLERILHKLLINFTWWVNRKDEDDHNIFQGGFLGMDNIGIFDRSQGLPGSGHIDQADGTSWMAMYSLNVMRICLELSKHNDCYQDLASKFFEHFLYIAGAMTNIGKEGMGLWDDDDQFFYDSLHLSNDGQMKIKVRTMVGLIPLFAVEVLDPALMDSCSGFEKRLDWFLDNKPELASLVSRWKEHGMGERRLLSLLRGSRMKKLLKRMLDETEFLSEYGIRSLSKYYEANPFTINIYDSQFNVKYLPAESDSNMFGGNSNWRGPIWIPMNYLLIESLQRFHHYYGDDFKIEYPTNSGNYITIKQVSEELTQRLIKLFMKDKHGNRPVYGNNKKFNDDPNFKNYVLFYEYFDGDTGKGLGASHQTGWTALVAKLMLQRDHQDTTY